MFDAVIFDLDGTLIDTEALALRSGRAALARLDGDIDPTILNALVGRDQASGDAILRAACPDLDLVRLKDLWTAAFDREMAAGLPLKPGARDLLDRLVLPRAICTSSQRATAHAKLDIAGLAADFSRIVTREDVTCPKPHPEAYLLAARLLEVAPGRCLVFEDSDTGAAAAMAAGCHVVQVPDVLPSDGAHAHHLAPSLIEGARMAGLL